MSIASAGEWVSENSVRDRGRRTDWDVTRDPEKTPGGRDLRDRIDCPSRDDRE